MKKDKNTYVYLDIKKKISNYSPNGGEIICELKRKSIPLQIHIKLPHITNENIIINKTFSPDMVCGEVISIILNELNTNYKINLKNSNIIENDEEIDEYGLYYWLDTKTNFWLEEAEKLGTYDLYKRKVKYKKISF